jgi:hypothetical protein
MTTMVPTAVATCAALGEGGSPSGVSLITMYTVVRYTYTRLNTNRVNKSYLNRNNNNNHQAFQSQASWGRLEKPHEPKKRDKTKVNKSYLNRNSGKFENLT